MLKTSQFKKVVKGDTAYKTAKIKKVLLLLQHTATLSTCS